MEQNKGNRHRHRVIAGRPGPLTGQTFGRLTAMNVAAVKAMPSGGTKTLYECRCACGGTTTSHASNLSTGRSQSCGCHRRERASITNRRHGEHHSKLHSVWSQMLQRCENPKNKRYAAWGGRGIGVCGRWHDYTNFRSDMGPTYRDGLSIDRIDNDGNYEPGNCRWATRKQQAANTRRTRREACA